MPKIDSSKTDESKGHTSSEWGFVSDESSRKKIRVVEAYTVIWDD